jgi:chromosome segregation ATPase
MVGEAADKYGLDADVLEAQAKQIRRYNKDLKLTEKQAANLAIANQRMNKGVKALNENFEDWKKTLTTADKTSMDYAEALTEVESAIGDLVGASDDFELPEGFLDTPENLALIERAAKGDEAAINQLGLSLSSASIKALEFNESLAQMYNEAFGGNIDLASFETAKQTVLDGIAAIQANMAGLLDGSV